MDARQVGAKPTHQTKTEEKYWNCNVNAKMWNSIQYYKKLYLLCVSVWIKPEKNESNNL